MKNTFRFLAVCLALFVSSAAFAGSFTFSTAPGTVDSNGDPVNATATFTTSAGNLLITVQNLLVNQKDVGQNISDLFFTLSGGTTGSLFSSSGMERTIAANGTFTDGASVATGWVLSETAGVFHLDGLNGALNTPAHTIVGAPDGSNVYSAANNSITGNGPHNPFLAGTVSFSVNVTGLLATDSVTGATFSFGTTPGDTGHTVPDGGSTLMLLGAALGGLGAMRRFVRR